MLRAHNCCFDGDLGGGVIERLNRCVLRLQRARQTCSWVYQGVAVGAACNIALATDLRLASDAARLWGSVYPRGPGTGWRRGPTSCRVSWRTAKAMELMLLAEIIDAQEALRLGLVNWVVPADTLQDETQKLAERLAQGPTLRMGWSKSDSIRASRCPSRTS